MLKETCPRAKERYLKALDGYGKIEDELELLLKPPVIASVASITSNLKPPPKPTVVSTAKKPAVAKKQDAVLLLDSSSSDDDSLTHSQLDRLIEEQRKTQAEKLQVTKQRNKGNRRILGQGSSDSDADDSDAS